MEIQAHQGHGVRDPAAGTPDRRKASLRRTTVIDMMRPDGLTGTLFLNGTGRDLLTKRDGASQVLDVGTFRCEVDLLGGRILRSIQTDPFVRGLSSLEGASALVGFRRALDENAAYAETCDSVLVQLLDDLPVAALIVGHAQMADERMPGVPKAPLVIAADVCSGWEVGGFFVSELLAGRRPTIQGPLAPPLERPDDPDAWPEVAGGEPTMMRRRRRLDLYQRGEMWLVESFLRDSHWLGSGEHRGTETVMHEYLVRASIGVDDHVLRSVRTSARVLPWQECMSAATSAQALVGQQVSKFRSVIPGSLVGVGSCTHLNDVLRAISPLASLAETVSSTP